MNHLLQKSAFAFLAIGLAAGITACDGEYGDACTFPKAEQLAVCGSAGEEDSTAGTCVYRNAPDCSTKICATYGAGKPFCTLDCDVDADCETGSTCEAVVDESGKVCIPTDRQ